MVFRTGLVPAALVPAFGALAILLRLFTGEPFVTITRTNLASCTKNIIEPLRSFLCIIEPTFIAARADAVALSVLCMIIQYWLAVSVWLFEQGGKPGRSPLLSPIVSILISLAGQLIGLGPAFAIFLPMVSAIIKASEKEHTGLSSPASATYTRANIACHTVVLVVSGIALITSPVGNIERWRTFHYAFQMFPLYFAPLVLIGARRPNAGETRKPTTMFDIMSVAFIFTWWLNVSVVVFVWADAMFHVSPQTLFMFYDLLGFPLAVAGLYAVEVVAGDARSLPNPFGEILLRGPPAAACAMFAAREKQSARRAELLKKTK